MNILEVINLSHTYGANTPFEHIALENISFSLGQGETLGIIGATGSGKSTLVSHLNGLIKPQSGTVMFNGENIWQNGKCKKGLRFKVGLVFQYPEYQLFEDTSYLDIAYGPKNMGLSQDEIDKCVLDAAAAVGLSNDDLSKSPFELSGGKKRRVAIAGIMAMNPQVLVLDEPSAGLDPAGKKLIEKSINDYKAENNASVIIVSHSMEQVARMCDKVLVINNGKSVMFDTAKNVFSNREELFKNNLNCPRITEICAKLSDAGLNIPQGVFTVEAAAGYIANALKGGARNV